MSIELRNNGVIYMKFMAKLFPALSCYVINELTAPAHEYDEAESGSSYCPEPVSCKSTDTDGNSADGSPSSNILTTPPRQIKKQKG